LRRRLRISFFGLLKHSKNTQTRTEIIATFLAILELARRSMVKAEQIEAFGDIEIVRLGNWDYSDIEAFSPELEVDDSPISNVDQTIG